MLALAFHMQHHALAENAMAHALAETQTKGIGGVFADHARTAGEARAPGADPPTEAHFLHHFARQFADETRRLRIVISTVQAP